MDNNDLANPIHPHQQAWNKRYQQAEQANIPAQVLTDNLHLLPKQGSALELACGLGGNALLLARCGLDTQAWDLSDVAIAKLQQQADQQQLPLRACCIDLEHQPLTAASVDIICVSSFLDRSLCPSIVAALKPQGLLFYQTFTRAKHLDSGPSNPEFLLMQGELLGLFAELTPLAYREELGCGDLSLGLRNQAYLVARK